MPFDPAKLAAAKKSVFDPQKLAAVKTGASWSDVPKNAVTDVKDLVGGLKAFGDRLANIPPEILDRISNGDFSGLASDALSGARKLGDIAGNAPQAILDRVQELSTHPIQAFKEHPVNTALDVAPLVSPAVRAVTAEIPALSRAAVGAGSAAETLGKKLVTATLGPSSDAVEARLANPSAIKNALPSEALAERLPATLSKLQEQVSTYDKLAWDTLSKSHDPLEGAIPKADIAKKIDQIKNSFRITGGGAAGEADSRAVAKLDAIKNRVMDLGQGVRGSVKSEQGVNSILKNKDFISESRLKEIIQSFDHDINYNDVLAGQTNRAISEVRTTIDGVLKEQNPAYRKAMVPVAERTALLDSIPQKFNLQRQADGAFAPGNKTATNLETALKEKTLASRKSLEQLREFTGENYLKDIETAKNAKQFDGGVTQGSRRTGPMATAGASIGGGAGAFMAGPLGAGVGAGLGGATGYLLGSHLDVSGREIAGKLLDWYANRTPSTAMGRLAEIGARGPSVSPALEGLLSKLSSVSPASAVENLLNIGKQGGAPSAPSPAFQHVLQAAGNITNSTAEPSRAMEGPPSFQAYRGGLEAFLKGDRETAKKLWQEAYRLDPNNLEARRGLERLATQNGERVDAYKTGSGR